jgi:hypothetical protein
MSNEWTTEKPTKPGHYWGWAPSHQRIIGIIELIERHGELYEPISGLYVADFTHTTHWIGPLPEPLPPVAEATQ